MKLFAVGLWVVLVALGCTYAAAVYLPPPGSHAPAPVQLQVQKTRVINVPIIVDGGVQGFMSMQFAYTIDANTLKSLQVPPEVYLLDEAFRAVYTDNTLDIRHVEKYDLGQLTHQLVETTNAHLGAPLIKDVLIENFSYVGKDINKDVAK